MTCMRASFSMCQSHISLLLFTSFLLYFCDGFRNDFYLVYTSILAPILASIFELSGSSLAFVGDQKLARFRLSFLVVFDPKMAPKVTPKRCTEITLLHPVLRPKFLTPPLAHFGPHLGSIWVSFGFPFGPHFSSIRPGSLPGRPGPRNGSKLPRLTRQSDTSGPTF